MQLLGNIGAIAAHRGWHQDGAPENSIAALERAAGNGVDFVEMDTRRLADGTIVIHHDTTLDGVALGELDRSALAAHPEVATLDDWSRRAGELGVGVLAELKEPGYEREVLDTLRTNLRGNRLDLFSFDASAARAMSRLAPDHAVGLLTDVGRPEAATAASIVDAARGAGASFVGLNVRQTTEPILAALDAAGLGAAVWTVDRPADIVRLLADRRVSTVISDVPRQALAIRSTMTGGLHEASGAVRLLRAAATMR